MPILNCKNSLNIFQITLIIAIPIMIWHITFAGVLIHEKDAPWLLRWNFELDFLKHSMDGMVTSIFGWNREKLECNEIYCHFQKPADLLKVIETNQNTNKVFYVIAIICFVLHIVTYMNIKRKLKN